MRYLATALLCLASLVGSAYGQSDCTGDISGDGRTDGVDLAIVLTNWGPCNPGSAISGVYPQSGSTAGGTPIAIVGVDLGATASVTIDGVAAQSFSVASPTVVTAVTPPGTVGAKTIALRNSQGQQIAAASFRYAVTSLPWATVLQLEPDPAVVTNSALRTAIAISGLPWRVRDNGTGIEMLLVPPGTFDIGCIQGSDNFGCYPEEQPVHAVTLTDAYYIGRYEVTQAQWQVTMGSNPSYFVAANGYPGLTTRPVENVSWNTIQGFLLATGMRLPTEAEWEYACRAGTTTPFHSGPGFPNGTTDDTLRALIAWGTEIGRPQPVGGRAANALGLYDMLGNAWEFCSDWIASYPDSAQTNPSGPSAGLSRVLRGGGIYGISDIARSSFRVGFPPDQALISGGFRVARNP